MFRVLDPIALTQATNALNHAVGQSIWVTLGAAMQDTPLTAMLASFGLEGANAESAMEVLYQRGLTRPGKKRIALLKATAVEQAIREALVRACHKHMCTRKAATAAAHSSRRVVRVPARYCDLCSGQDNRLAVDGMLQAMQTAHCTKLLVAGGSPGTLDALNTLVADRCGLRVISGQDRPSGKTGKERLAWADVVVIWASTEIPHKLTETLKGPKVITGDCPVRC